MRQRLLTLLLALAASGCAQQQPIADGTVDHEFAIGGGEWNTGGGITIAVKVLERDGATVVCGAWAADRQSALTVGLNDGVIEAGSVYAGGVRVVQNLSFMPEVKDVDALLGAGARCVRSSVAWRSEFGQTSPEVRIPRIVHDESADEAGIGGRSVVFRETLRDNPFN